MNTILQKRIEEAAKEIGKKFYFVGMNPNEAAYKAAIQMGNKILQNQWISVEESLPPHKPIGQNQRFSLPVFLINNNDVTTAYIDSYDFEQPSENVTHWAPIPSLKGGEK